jgi:polar amino acid transport system substrate-binding protein
MRRAMRDRGSMLPTGSTARATGVLLALLIAIIAPAPTAAQAPVEEPAAATDLPRRLLVRFVTEADFPPFNFYDEDGVLTGFNVDLARAICLELAATCDIKVRPWNELFLSLRRGEADASIAAHAVAPSALAEVDFTDRYFHTPGRFAARRDIVAKSEITPEGLEGRRLGVAARTAHEAFLKDFFRNSAIKVFETVDLAREALLQGEIDFLFDDGVGLAFWVNGTLSRQCCELVGGPFLEPRYFGDGIAIAVSKKDPQIKALINGALKRVREGRRLEELVQRYFPVRIY